jgi:hypothetical protein
MSVCFVDTLAALSSSAWTATESRGGICDETA